MIRSLGNKGGLSISIFKMVYMFLRFVLKHSTWINRHCCAASGIELLDVSFNSLEMWTKLQCSILYPRILEVVNNMVSFLLINSFLSWVWRVTPTGILGSDSGLLDFLCPGAQQWSELPNPQAHVCCYNVGSGVRGCWRAALSAVWHRSLHLAVLWWQPSLLFIQL